MAEQMDIESKDEGLLTRYRSYQNRCGSKKTVLSLLPEGMVLGQRLAGEDKDLILVGQIAARRCVLGQIKKFS